MKISNFSWEQFDESVCLISEKAKDWKLSGIYGIPRGGLCLAVALSHKLNLEFINQPKDNILIVDDIYDSGMTLNKYKKFKNSKYFVLMSKSKPTWWNTHLLIEKDKWVVFPWENNNNYIPDMNNYKEKRK